MLRRVRAWWKFRQVVRALRAQSAAAGSVSLGRDVVVIPCWRRPEFLWHCLDNLSRAEGSAELHYLYRPDTGYSADNLKVIRAFADRLPHFEIAFPEICPYRRSKQSANILLAYLMAAQRAQRHVFLIEEDIMVAEDFFRWHRAVQHTAGNLFCSIAVRNPNRPLQLPDDSEGYYLSSGDYCSLGVCFDKQVLTQLLAPHVTLAYFSRPKRYVRRQFPDSRVGLGFTEQDGLLRRIQEHSRRPIAFPCVARAYHAGFYGYHRPGGMNGELSERVQALREIIYSAEEMDRAAIQPQFAQDSVPVALQARGWKVMRQVPVSPPDQLTHADESNKLM